MVKQTDDTTNVNEIPDTVLDATSSLAENLAQSEPILRYKAAAQRLHADPRAMQLLSDLSALQQKVRQQQYAGTVSQNDLRQLRALQNEAGANDAIQDQFMTEQLAIAFLQEVNQEISQLLNVDFASLARRSSGCC